MYDNKATDCKGYLFALNGSAWLTMTKQQKAHEWDNLMSRRRIVGHKTFVNPYKSK